MSFLVRMWREGTELPELNGHWQGEVEHVQTGRRWAFDNLDELLGFLRLATQAPESLWPPSLE